METKDLCRAWSWNTLGSSWPKCLQVMISPSLSQKYLIDCFSFLLSWLFPDHRKWGSLLPLKMKNCCVMMMLLPLSRKKASREKKDLPIKVFPGSSKRSTFLLLIMNPQDRYINLSWFLEYSALFFLVWRRYQNFFVLLCVVSNWEESKRTARDERRRRHLAKS